MSRSRLRFGWSFVGAVGGMLVGGLVMRPLLGLPPWNWDLSQTDPLNFVVGFAASFVLVTIALRWDNR